MSDNKLQSPPAGYPEGNPPPGYPTQHPPQYAEAAGPVKTKMREEEGCFERCLAALSDNKLQSPPAGYPEGNPPPGYPTQHPPQYAEAAGPVKTKMREEEGCCERCLAALCCCREWDECC